MVPFGPLRIPHPLVCAVATKATELVNVLPSMLIGPSIHSSSNGPTTSSSHSRVNTSASFSMQGALVPRHLQTVTATTLAPSAATLATVRRTAPITDLNKILYIRMCPYNPTSWHDALSNCDLSSYFPNLVHDITYGSPIGNPPALTSSFIPGNLPSADLHPEIIDQELSVEVKSG